MHDSIHVPTTGWTVNHAVFLVHISMESCSLFIFQYISSQFTLLDYEKEHFSMEVCTAKQHH